MVEFLAEVFGDDGAEKEEGRGVGGLQFRDTETPHVRIMLR
jgi:hypothetical protein